MKPRNEVEILFGGFLGGVPLNVSVKIRETTVADWDLNRLTALAIVIDSPFGQQVVFADRDLRTIRVDRPCESLVNGSCRYYWAEWAQRGLPLPFGIGFDSLPNGISSHDHWNTKEMMGAVWTGTAAEKILEVRLIGNSTMHGVPSLLQRNGTFWFHDQSPFPARIEISTAAGLISLKKLDERGHLPSRDALSVLPTLERVNGRIAGTIFPGSEETMAGIDMSAKEVFEWATRNNETVRGILTDGCIDSYFVQPSRDEPVLGEPALTRLELQVHNASRAIRLVLDYGVLNDKRNLSVQRIMDTKPGASCADKARGPAEGVPFAAFQTLIRDLPISYWGRPAWGVLLGPYPSDPLPPETGWFQYGATFRPAFVSQSEAFNAYQLYQVGMHAYTGKFRYMLVSPADVTAMDGRQPLVS